MASIRQHLPAPLKRLVRYAVYCLMDVWDSLRGGRPPMVPPRVTSLIVGSGNFLKTGIEFRDYLIRLAGLQPTHRVLEIGAGYGRMAVGLTSYLAPPGSYDGVEIIQKAVDWCSKEISGRHPHFRFHHADVGNPYSNPSGASGACGYTLPFADSSFDIVFLTSVFSHMRPVEIEAYLREIERVLAPGGKCFITYYLLDEFALQQIRQKRASQPFYHAFDGFLSTSRTTPENTIAIPEQWVRALYGRCNLEINYPLHYGAWSGRQPFLTYQDVVVAQKPL